MPRLQPSFASRAELNFALSLACMGEQRTDLGMNDALQRLLDQIARTGDLNEAIVREAHRLRDEMEGEERQPA